MLQIDPWQSRVFKLCKQSDHSMAVMHECEQPMKVELEMCRHYEVIYTQVPTESQSVSFLQKEEIWSVMESGLWAPPWSKQ